MKRELTHSISLQNFRTRILKFLRKGEGGDVLIYKRTKNQNGFDLPTMDEKRQELRMNDFQPQTLYAE